MPNEGGSDSEGDVKNVVEGAALEMGNKAEADFISTQKKHEAISLLVKNEGDSNNPIFLREELSKCLYTLANESIEKERVKKKMDTVEKLRKESKRKETDLKQQIAQMNTTIKKQ